MCSALEGELRSLLIYYGENPDSPDAPKPEDLFGLIASFSSSLQVGVCLHDYKNFNNDKIQKCALQVYDAEEKLDTSIPKHPEEPGAPAQDVSISLTSVRIIDTKSEITQTFKGKANPVPLLRQFLMPPPAKSQGYAAGQRSVGRGYFDQAIRSMRDGKRRARPQASRPLSKMFLDGSSGGSGRPQSRLFE